MTLVNPLHGPGRDVLAAMTLMWRGGPEASLISVYLSWTLSYRSASGKGLLSLGQNALLACFLAFVGGEMDQHETAHWGLC